MDIVFMNKGVYFIILLLINAFSGVLADEVRFSATAPSEVAVGDRFRLVFSVNARPQHFTPPAFDSFRVLSGPSQSSSTSTRIINNQVTTSVNISYTYVLEATGEGEFSIANASVKVDGNSYLADPLQIKVLPRGSATQPSTSSHRQQESRETALPDRDDIFIRAQVSNTEPYQGEQVIISYKLYTRIDITNYTIDELPSFQGFWSENLSREQSSASIEQFNGINYRVAEIRRVAVFPQRAGELRIDPMSVDMSVRIRRQQQQRGGNLIDEFFGGSPFDRFQTLQHSVRSNAITIQAKQLPVQSRPAGFTGIVGTYEINTRLQPDELDVNDASNLLFTIEGTGNIRMLEPPEIQFPRHLDVFDPRIEDNVNTDNNGISGSRTFDFLMIPRSAGMVEIPSISFSYFDPSKNEYVTKSTNPLTLHVKGNAASVSDQPRMNDEAFLGDDIRFIKVNSFNLRSAGMLFFKSRNFYLLLVSPVILLIIFLMIYRKQLQKKNDVAGARTRRAQKIAVKRLRLAKKYLMEEKKSAFFDEIFRALWGYVSDKLNIPPARLSKDNIAVAFRERKVSPELAEKFLEGLSECELARFSPAGNDNPMQETYLKAMDTIITLEKELRIS
jgi:hypothetical protein